MIAAGLDIGALWTKAVVLRDGVLAGWSMAPSSDDGARAAETALVEALRSLGAAVGDIQAAVATGVGKNEIRLPAKPAAEVLCAALGASSMFPGAAGVIDMGGESTRVVRLDGGGQVADYAVNDKCAAGTGVFLDAMAKAMGVPVEEMGPLSLKSTKQVPITSMCVAFAESEVVTLVHSRTPKEDILMGIHQSIASRIFGLVSRAGLPGNGGSTIAVGGLSRNVGILSCLETLMKGTVVVPENPRILSALGAALIASGKGGGA